jgi:molecular chaperone GrpE
MESISDQGQAAGPGGDAEAHAALAAENAQLRDHLLRVAADLDNFKKRVRKERDEGERRARGEVLLDVLEVLDALELASATLDAGADPAVVREGVALGLRALRKNLGHHGLEPVVTLGARFDPRLHEALARMPSTVAEPGTVVEEVTKGYVMDGRLLRPARVVVAAPPSPDDDDPTPIPD